MTPKLRKDGTPKKSGGPRTIPSRKAMNQDLLPWPVQLERALRLAANNHYILPREKFLTKSQVSQLYGKKAAEEFGQFFKSLRRFDQDKADAIRHKQSLGLFNVPPESWNESKKGSYTPQKYANWLVKNKCFTWQSVLWDHHWRDVWMQYGDQSHLS